MRLERLWGNDKTTFRLRRAALHMKGGTTLSVCVQAGLPMGEEDQNQPTIKKKKKESLHANRFFQFGVGQNKSPVGQTAPNSVG